MLKTSPVDIIYTFIKERRLKQFQKYGRFVLVFVNIEPAQAIANSNLYTGIFLKSWLLSFHVFKYLLHFENL